MTGYERDLYESVRLISMSLRRLLEPTKLTREDIAWHLFSKWTKGHISWTTAPEEVRAMYDARARQAFIAADSFLAAVGKREGGDAKVP